MARPVVGSIAEQAYEAMTPVTYAEVQLDYPMLRFFQSIGLMTQDVEDLVRDTPLYPGWSKLVDPLTCPVDALPWLAQLVGVQLPGGLTVAQQRQRIDDTAGWVRGSPASFVAAIVTFLTGSRTVILRERFPTPYSFQVITKTSETPVGNIPLINQAILDQKPGGLVCLWSINAGQDYQQLLTNHSTYQLVFTDYATYQELLDDS